jgi:hypothetical protein
MNPWWKVEKIISGGQTGADLGALKAAASLGLETGGCMPLGAKTEKGPRPDIAETYGLQITNSQNYPHRTFLVVMDADAMLIFHRTGPQLGPGSRLTLRLCWTHNTPVWLCRPGYVGDERFAALFVHATKARILAVGGARESTAQGIEKDVEISLSRILRMAAKLEVPA